MLTDERALYGPGQAIFLFYPSILKEIWDLGWFWILLFAPRSPKGDEIFLNSVNLSHSHVLTIKCLDQASFLTLQEINVIDW